MTLRRLRHGLAAAALAGGMALGGMAGAESGGTISWGKPTEVISFDPHLSGDGASWSLFHLVYDQLLSTDDDFNLAPGLAESWEEVSATSYRFNLRPDAAFFQRPAGHGTRCRRQLHAHDRSGVRGRVGQAAR